MDNTYKKYPFKKDLDITHLISLFKKNTLGDFVFEGESHDFWEFIYIDKGSMLITTGNKQYILKAGELAFHKPHEFHAVCTNDNTESIFIVASFVCTSPCMKFFEHRIMSLTRKEQGILHEIVRYKQQNPGFLTEQNILDTNSEQMKNEFFGQSQLVQQHLELLLINLIQRNEGVKIQSRVETYVMKKMYDELVNYVIIYLENHLTEQVTLKQISVDLGYSIPQMKKLFRSRMHCGIIDYFIDMKMNEAKRLMKEGSMHINQIATHLGYTDASYFSRLFKSRQNMTPQEYSRSYDKT